MRELLFSLTKKDFEVTYFSGTGAGGQHRNKHMNCVRIKHKETGIVKTGQEERSLQANKKKAFESLVNDKQFRLWLNMKTSSMVLEKSKEKDVPDILTEMLAPVHLKIEYQDENGDWYSE